MNRSPSPYGRQVGANIELLLRFFSSHVPDRDSNAQVLKLAASQNWSGAHQLRNDIRGKWLKANDGGNAAQTLQYAFEESCLETLYNDLDPADPFDAISPYWVVPNALRLAQELSLSQDDLVGNIWPAN